MTRRPFSVLTFSLVLISFPVGCGTSGDVDDGMGQAGGAGDGTGAGNGSVPGAPGDNTCETVNVAAEQAIPNVLIVFDRSGSMSDRIGDATTAVEQAVGAFDQQVAFGLQRFSGAGIDGAGDGCSVPMNEPAPRLMASEELEVILGSTSAVGGTPTAPALERAGQTLLEMDGSGYVLLVTDGLPNCNKELDRTTCECTGNRVCPGGWFFCADSERVCESVGSCLDIDRTVSTIEGLTQEGIGTYVIGWDTKNYAERLDAMAKAGGTERDTHIGVGDTDSLRQTLESLAGDLVSCDFELENTPSDIRYVKVTMGGSTIDHESVAGDGEGWSLNGNRVSLRGAACNELKQAESAEVNITVECELVLL